MYDVLERLYSVKKIINTWIINNKFKNNFIYFQILNNLKEKISSNLFFMKEVFVVTLSSTFFFSKKGIKLLQDTLLSNYIATTLCN